MSSNPERPEPAAASGGAGLQPCHQSGRTHEDAAAAKDLAELQRDEALRTVRAVREELTVALRERDATERRLAEHIQQTEIALMKARDEIDHMRRSRFWRARTWSMRLRRLFR